MAFPSQPGTDGRQGEALGNVLHGGSPLRVQVVHVLDSGGIVARRAVRIVERVGPGVGCAHGDSVAPAVAQGCEESGISRCGSVGEIADGKELRIGTVALSGRSAEGTRSDLIDRQDGRQMHAMIAFIVEIENPVVAEVLLDAKLPLLEIRKHPRQLPFHRAEGGIREAGRNQRQAVRADVGVVGGNSLR